MKILNKINENSSSQKQTEANKTSIEFKTGNILLIDTEYGEMRLIDENKNVQLIITVSEAGLVLNVNAFKVNINSIEELNLKGKKINIEGTDQINIKTSGNLVQQIGKDFLTEVSGTIKQIAQIQKITATLGNVDIKANDDVRLDGERIKLNCD